MLSGKKYHIFKYYYNEMYKWQRKLNSKLNLKDESRVKVIGRILKKKRRFT